MLHKFYYLTERDRAKIRALHKDGMTAADLARRFRVSTTCIRAALKGES